MIKTISVSVKNLVKYAFNSPVLFHTTILCNLDIEHRWFLYFTKMVKVSYASAVIKSGCNFIIPVFSYSLPVEISLYFSFFTTS